MKIRLISVSMFASLLLTFANTGTAFAADPDRVFLQQLSPHSAIVKWRGGDTRLLSPSLRPGNVPERTASTIAAMLAKIGLPYFARHFA